MIVLFLLWTLLAGRAVAHAAPTCLPAAWSGGPPAVARVWPTAVEEGYNCLLDNYGGASAATPAALLTQGWNEASAVLPGSGVALAPLPPDRAGAYRVFAGALAALLATTADPQVQNEVARAAIRGMAESLRDDHTTYLTPAQLDRELQALAGQPVTGLGAHLSADADRQQVFFFSLAPGGPADSAGVQPGDVLEALNGQSIADLLARTQAPPAALAEAIARRSWPAGTLIHLDLFRPRTGDHLHVTVPATSVAMPDVEGGVRSGAAYAHLWLFSARSARELRNLLQAELDQGANAVVLDVRDDPGGSLDNARTIASMFTHQNPLAILRDKSEQENLDANPAVPLVTLPLTVLIDSGSASAAEFLAAALQDAHAATVVGTRSAGAIGTAEIFALADGSGLEITVAQLLRSTGLLLDGAGVQPDLAAPLTADALSRGHDPALDTALGTSQEGLPIGTWVVSVSAAAQLWSGSDGNAISFGRVPGGSRFLIVAPPQGGRYFVLDPRTNNYAWVDAALVRPANG